jgi:hypothetical protein
MRQSLRSWFVGSIATAVFNLTTDNFAYSFVLWLLLLLRLLLLLLLLLHVLGGGAGSSSQRRGIK